MTHINIVSVSKTTQVDSYNEGCNPDTCKWVHVDPPDGEFTNIVDAFKALVKDNSILAEHITTMDPNIYRDMKDGSTRTVKDNTAVGVYRCCYNRNENTHGRKPTAAELERFKAGEIDLKLADYDICFTLQTVGLDEAELAELVGCTTY
jgi:hypothetical protein